VAASQTAKETLAVSRTEFHARNSKFMHGIPSPFRNDAGVYDEDEDVLTA